MNNDGRAITIMQKKALFLFFFCIATTGFTESIVLNYQGNTPAVYKKYKVAIQWASSAKEVETSNINIRQGIKLDSNGLQTLTRLEKINVNIPDKAEYFRVILWTNGSPNPDLLTSWVDIIPNKTYNLNQDYFVPAALMSGTGC